MSSVTIEKEELISIIDDQIRKNREKELSQSKVSYFQPEHYTQHDINIIERITKVEKGIESLIEQIKLLIEMTNKRFEAIDKRFEDLINNLDKRFEAIDKRFEDMRYYTDKRFEALDKKLTFGYWVMILGFAALAFLITYFSIFK